ncbi:MAG TPA: hypothetical protein VIL71_21815, partial [Spirillospora sp.]
MLVDAMLRTGHPISEIAAEKFDALADPTLNDELCERALTVPRAARLCRERGLAPTDPVKRAVFFVITGRPEQHHALDPDGSLLSLGYASASDEVRAKLREALPAAGDLDLLRVIAGDDRRGRITAMSEEEILYLAEQLAARREWRDLWTLAKDLPIATAVRVVRLFRSWTPRHSDERRLFRLMRGAKPGAIRSGVAQLRKIGFRRDDRLAMPRAAYSFDCRVNDVSFAPDGPFLAVGGDTRVAGVFDLRTAELVARYDEFARPVGRVLHLGDGAVIAGESNQRALSDCRLMHCSPSGTRVLHTTGAITSLALTGENGSFVATTMNGELLLGRADEPVTVRRIQEFGLGKRQWPRYVVAHRETGRLLLVGRSLHAVDPAAGNTPLTAWPGRVVARAAFADAETLVCAGHDGTIVRIPVPDGRPGGIPPQPQAHVPGLTGLGVLPHSGLVVVSDAEKHLHFFALTAGEEPGGGLEPVGVHKLSRNDRPTSLTVSPNGEFVAVGYRSGTIDLLDLRAHEIAGIVDRPVVDLLPFHLDLAALAEDDPTITGDARKALALLRACLEHRFRFDIEIGDAVQLKAGEYDISL